MTDAERIKELEAQVAELQADVDDINARMVNDLKLWQHLFGVRIVQPNPGQFAFQIQSVKDEKTDRPGLLAELYHKVGKLWRSHLNEPQVSLPNLASMDIEGQG